MEGIPHTPHRKKNPCFRSLRRAASLKEMGMRDVAARGLSLPLSSESGLIAGPAAVPVRRAG